MWIGNQRIKQLQELTSSMSSLQELCRVLHPWLPQLYPGLWGHGGNGLGKGPCFHLNDGDGHGPTN